MPNRSMPNRRLNLRRTGTWVLVIGLLVALLGGGVWAQWGRRGRMLQRPDLANVDRNGVPEWPVNPDFPHDHFTFVRIEYDSWRFGGKWLTDFPDSDLNFSYRLQELTAMKVNPQAKIVRLTDPELFDYPFVYMIEPGDLVLSD